MANLTYTVLFVADMARSVAFYRDVVGLTLGMESPDWSEFETGDCKLALHKAAAVDPLPHPVAGSFPAGHVHPGFNVKDMDEFASRMSAAGVECMRPVKLEDFGAKMGVWRDPDGIPFTVASFG